LDKAEERLANFGVIGADIDAVKRQIKELKDFKADVDPMMVKVEALNRSVESLSPFVSYVFSYTKIPMIVS
jgi:dystonin